jgi:FkbM family methyltransferase
MNVINNFFSFAYNTGRKLFGNRGLRKIPALNSIYVFLAKRVKIRIIETDGFSMEVDALEGVDFNNWEKEVADVIKKHSKGAVFLDIGAETGIYTCMAAKSGAKEVIAFEPNPNSFKLLKKNIERNDLSNVKVFDKAVSDKNERVTFYPQGVYSSFYRQDNFKNSEPITVECIVLDDLLKDKKIDLIKMDIEGAESKALRGMKKLLQKNKDVKLIIEFSPVYFEAAKENSDEFLSSLKEMGFKYRNLDSSNLFFTRS